MTFGQAYSTIVLFRSRKGSGLAGGYKVAIGLCSLSGLFCAVATVIVLALIPLYLATREVNLKRYCKLALFLLINTVTGFYSDGTISPPVSKQSDRPWFSDRYQPGRTGH
jgi:hypothetical protein